MGVTQTSLPIWARGPEAARVLGQPGIAGIGGSEAKDPTAWQGNVKIITPAVSPRHNARSDSA